MLKNHLELTADRCGTGRWYINIDGGNLTCSSLEEAKSIILRELGVKTVLPPHGDLIDQSKIYAEAVELSGPITGDGWDNFGVYDLIKRQPVVVPAERSDTK